MIVTFSKEGVWVDSKPATFEEVQSLIEELEREREQRLRDLR